jgi:hypothetical protein
MKTVEERFWEKVDKKSDDECWEWQGFKGKKNYGRFVALGEQLAHRVSWKLFINSKIPYGLVICHHFDNPSCVNPNHLFLGTVLDNNRDRHSKGRTVVPNNQGSKSGNAKLTETDVKEILKLHNLGVSNKEIIRKINKVNGSVVSEIIHRKLWTHVTV